MDRYASNMVAAGVWLMVGQGTNQDTWHGIAAAVTCLIVAIGFWFRACSKPPAPTTGDTPHD
ncbi:MAG: hypothetical protein FJX25_02435 [Alphaproteobacteria bacterium]|nr:hypothetical protein [Alphaproteobacteria bacterium]